MKKQNTKLILICVGVVIALVVGVYALTTSFVPVTWATMAFTVVMTLWSGINYLAAYWKYLDPEK